MGMSWRADPSVVVGIVLVAALYAAAATGWRGRQRGASPPTPGQVLSFGLALLVTWLTLESPLDDLADHVLFSAHMFQHLLLVLVLPPLLLAGLTGAMLRPLLLAPAVRSIARWLTRPLVAFTLFNVIFALAHVPAIFDRVDQSEAVHAAEHLLFVACGVLLWWPVLSPLKALPRLSHPLQLGYLFLQTLPCALLGAMITLAGGPLYAGYAATAPGWGLSGQQDQQIGGLLMWIGGSLYYFFAMAVVFFLWAGVEERQTVPLSFSSESPNGVS